jgi:hypothetical protein
MHCTLADRRRARIAARRVGVGEAFQARRLSLWWSLASMPAAADRPFASIVGARFDVHPVHPVRRPWMLAALLLAAGCYSGGEVAQDDSTGTGGTAGTGNTPTESGATDASSGGSEGGEEPTVVLPQPLHRLNRLEYNNTVRDLLGTTLRPADAFGPDPEANGFDNMAEQLHVSATVLEGYDKAARDVVANALDDVPAFQARFVKEQLAVPGGYPVGELFALSGNVLSVQVTVPEFTDAEIVLDAGAGYGGTAPPPELQLQVNGVGLPVFAVQGSAAVPAAHIQPIALAAGVHTVSVVPTNHVNMAADNIFNNVFVAALTVRSTKLAPGPGRGLVFVCEPASPGDVACYSQILHTFARRAWRRPLDAAEELGLVDLWNRAQQQGESADGALRLVLRAVMLSPKFFYRMRTTADADGEGWLDDYVLASRLSYFLWSSMPDDRLFTMAAEGRLATDEGLSEAVEFMLADPRSQALLDGFAEQWLAVRALRNYMPNPEVFPGFDDDVRAAMAAESKLFFGDFLANGQPMADLVLPDFAYRNDRLATHYGLPPVGSSELQRMPASGADRRGLLALGAWLTATSDASHSSPIRRGRWVSDTLLCTPIPPPPAGLVFDPPELGGSDSVREALEKHRSDPTCAGCHSLLDVLGIGFEEYDGVAQPVFDPNLDNLGELPGGVTFEGAAELAALYTDNEIFVDCLTRKLFTYAAGRPPGAPDTADIREISVKATAEGQSLAEVIDAIVHLPAFRSPAPLDAKE